MTRQDTRFGQAPTAYDNMGFAFFGDLVNGQAPTTVVIPDGHFNQLPVVQAPTAARLAQLFTEQPNSEVFGPFTAADADVTAVNTRTLIMVPNRYVLPFLSQGMTPKAAYQALQGMVQQDHNEVACGPLIDWLRATLVRCGALQTPRTCSKPLATPTFVQPQDQQAFSVYHLGIVHVDFPQLNPTMPHNSAVLIAQGLTALTAEQRLAREEAQQQRASRSAAKSPSDFFGVQLDRLMRWCQVANEADLPPIYDLLANTKKGRIRITLQTAIEETLTQLHYVEEFP